MAVIEQPYPSSRPADEPLVGPGNDHGTVTDRIAGVVFGKTPLWWFGIFAFAGGLLTLLGYSVVYLLFTGTGIWGLNIPVGWGFAIINFVWWIGIGHAGTLISAILLLLNQGWRTSINRFAEAMTLFAVACAGLFPILHTGRPWLAAYWLLPYPNTMALWPQFRSPLIWDVFAVSTYFTISLLFWYVGLIPDLATMRDMAKNKVVKTIYGMFAMGWRGSAAHWHNYESAYLLLAGVSTPLVLSVHTVVSFDFAVAQVFGWHATIFPPYFVAGAIYAGFAMVLLLAIPIRKVFHLEDYITIKHLENMGKITLATGMIVSYGYFVEVFIGFYSGNQYEEFMILNRITGPYREEWFALIFCNAIAPQVFWFKKLRRSPLVLFIVSIIVSIGMWLERFIIVVTSLHRDFLPSSWGLYEGTFWDWSLYIGTFGLFLSLFFLFIRFVPMINIFEMRTILPKQQRQGET
ncbi:MAG: NrfD/PsrC family molybdoenzyme membrane anchor subunit [Acidobacteriota bacterium]